MIDTYGALPEYYGNLVSCAGNTFLLTRLEPAFEDTRAWREWRTRVRPLLNFSSDVAGLPTAILRYYSLSHNIAGVCVGEKVYLVGGQFKKGAKKKIRCD